MLVFLIVDSSGWLMGRSDGEVAVDLAELVEMLDSLSGDMSMVLMDTDSLDFAAEGDMFALI